MAAEGLPTAFDTSTCLRKGLCPVTKIRQQDQNPAESHDIYFEIHGSKDAAPETTHKILLIMGLNSSSFSWGPQVRHFPHTGKHEVLAFDNRGVGNSGYPRGPYSTGEMAQDVVALLDYVGWTERRSVNVVGVSLGGMIAQELATRIPERIRSLVLTVTTPGGSIINNFPPWKGLTSLAKLAFTLDPAKKIPLVLPMLWPDEWLDQPADGDPKGRTNREVQGEEFVNRANITKPQQFMGHLSQMVAGLTHHVSPDRLFQIAESIPKIVIVTGDEDHLVRPINSEKIHDAMTKDGKHKDKVQYLKWNKTGHGIHVQHERKFNELIERVCEEAQELVKDA